MRPYGSMKSNYFPSKKGFTLYMSVTKHTVCTALFNFWHITTNFGTPYRTCQTKKNDLNMFFSLEISVKRNGQTKMITTQ